MKTKFLFLHALAVLLVGLVAACQNTPRPSATAVPVQTIRPFATAATTPTFTLTALPRVTPKSTSVSIAVTTQSTIGATTTRNLHAEFQTSFARARTEEALRPTARPTLTDEQRKDAQLRAWVIRAKGPVEMRLTDPLGHRVGYRQNSSEPYSENPLGIYVYDHSRDELWLNLAAPPAGEYKLEIIGKSKGTFDIFGNYVDGRAGIQSFNFVLDGESETGSLESRTYIVPQRIVVLAREAISPPIELARELPVMFQIPLDELEFVTSTPVQHKTPDKKSFLTSKIECSFGDGSSASGDFWLTHSFEKAGEYTVICTVTSSNGNLRTYEANVLVK